MPTLLLISESNEHHEAFAALSEADNLEVETATTLGQALKWLAGEKTYDGIVVCALLARKHREMMSCIAKRRGDAFLWAVGSYWPPDAPHVICKCPEAAVIDLIVSYCSPSVQQ